MPPGCDFKKVLECMFGLIEVASGVLEDDVRGSYRANQVPADDKDADA
jgi:hypothetical protein